MSQVMENYDSVDVDKPGIFGHSNKKWIKGLDVDYFSVKAIILTQSQLFKIRVVTVTFHILKCCVLTQVCIVWRFINSMSAVGCTSCLQHLDPNREMTPFSIHLTPSTSQQ